jgi:hypothetical protein
MKTSCFSFGYDHVHRIDGRTYDADTVVRISAPDPRGVMLEKFGKEWCFEYDHVPGFARRLVDIVYVDGREIIYEDADARA